MFLQEEKGKKDEKKGKKKEKKEKESTDYPNSWLIYTVFKTFSWILFESAFFKLLQDLLSFVSPQLLKWVEPKHLFRLTCVTFILNPNQRLRYSEMQDKSDV